MENKPMETGQIARLLMNMLSPMKGERMLFITDYPEGKPTPAQALREKLLSRWQTAAQVLSERRGFRLLPVVKYRQTGKNNADLPKTAATDGGGHVDNLAELISSANIVIAINEYSATAPLKNIASRASALRVVSMPGVTAEMEGAMSADYEKIAEKCKKLSLILTDAVTIEVDFAGSGVPRGTRLTMDARGTRWICDDGRCPEPGMFINFPSGEVFAAPYEGATPEGRLIYGDSRTSGVMPVYSYEDGKIAFLKIEKNRIVKVQGDSAEAKRIGDDIANDANAANIAEIGLGVNERARAGRGVPVLESEKAGVHIAYGRSDHFGSASTHAGKVKASVHRDIVFARGCPIEATVYAVYQNGRKTLIAERGKVDTV